MRILIALVATVIAAPVAATAGDVSGDLVFCSKLTSPRERIACYDAAARIAARATAPVRTAPPTPARMVTKQVADHPAPAYDPPARAPFHGAYVAVGGSYGMGAPLNFTALDPVAFGVAGTGSPQGASFIGAGGFNLQSGNLVVGIELSGRYGQERFTQSFTSFGAAPSNIFGRSDTTYQFNMDSSVHAAIRAGFAIGDTLIFAKAGAGVSHFNETAVSAVNATRCTAGGFPPPLFNFVCTATEPVVPTSSARNLWLPSLLLGAGLEHNFGPAFGRVEAEAQITSRPNSPTDYFWSARAMAAVGVRF